MLRRNTALLVGVAIAASANSSHAAPVPDSLDSFVQLAMGIVGTPGVAVSVVHGERTLGRGYGVRTVGQPGCVDADTVFAIASNSKLFTGTVAALLESEGVLSLDAPLSRYLPQLRFADPYVTRNATVLDALAHRTGLATINMGWMLNPQATRADMIAQIEHLPLTLTFRQGWNYSNYMYTAVGEVILASSGKTWDQMVSERIFQPLGMTRSSTSTKALAGLDNVASPHAYRHGVTRAIDYHNIDSIAPAGAINSTANDMARWCQLQVGKGVVDGRRVIAEAVIEKTRQPYVARPLETSSEFHTGARYVSYGLGVGRRDYRRDYTLLSHTGGIYGMFSATLIVPEANLCVAVMTNRAAGSGLELTIAHAILERELAVADPTDWLHRLRTAVQESRERVSREAAELERGRNHAAAPTHKLDDYIGLYRHQLGALQVKRVGKALVLSAGLRQGTLVHWRYDTFTTDWEGDSAVPERVTFHLDDDGDVASLSATIDDAPVSFLREPAGASR